MTHTQYTESVWDFRTANTKSHTHCYHNYPAMMIPQIARKLIVKYGKNAKTLFDPYCGTGTSLVEATLKGINSIGTDLNPLARLISKAKTSKIEIQVLDLYLKEFSEFSLSLSFGLHRSNVILPDFKNIDFWFSKTIQGELSAIKQFVDNITHKSVQTFFYVAFSETVREVSFTRNSEFKLYRMTEEKMKAFKPDTFSIMISKLSRNRAGLFEYLNDIKDKISSAQVFGFNTVDSVENITKGSIDLIVTSPPYGDSRTTVAYGQFSRLANQWLGIKDANQVDNNLMGGGKKDKIQQFKISVLDEAIEKVRKEDPKRAKEVYSFYSDYHKSIKNISSTLKYGGCACYVVGNRRVKGITLPTDKITSEFFKKQGFKHEKTFIRNIPNKRMPSRNSPTNEVGKTATTMTNEYIVVMRKIAV